MVAFGEQYTKAINAQREIHDHKKKLLQRKSSRTTTNSIETKVSHKIEDNTRFYKNLVDPQEGSP